MQHEKPEDTSLLLDKSGKLCVQKVTATFLYYARSVNRTVLMVLSSTVSAQSSPTDDTMKKSNNSLTMLQPIQMPY